MSAPKLFYRTVSVEISGTDEQVVDGGAVLVARAVKKVVNAQLRLARVKRVNPMYQTVRKAGPDFNIPKEMSA